MNLDWKAQRDGTLLIHKLLKSQDTAPLVSSELLTEMALRAPNLLELHGAADPEENYNTSLSLLETLLERGEMDILKQAGPQIQDFAVDLSKKMKYRPHQFWGNLSKLPLLLPRLGSIHFLNNDLTSWSDEEKNELASHLPIYGTFPVRGFTFEVLTPNLLEFFLPMVLDGIKYIEYMRASLDDEASAEQEKEDDTALREKFAELKSAGRLSPHIKIKRNGEITALARDH